MPWTPLHAILGETSTALEYALIERAVDERVSEQTHLDWKRQLPLTAPKTDRAAKQAQQAELAKDIAAMANSGGGMIVFGIEETRAAGTSAAASITGVGPVDEDTTRDIRRVAGSLVYPPVVGLDLIHLTPTVRVGEPNAVQPDESSADESHGGVLVLLVPDSIDRPHLVHPANGRDWFGVPYRHGPDTAWMVERQIASAYVERDLGRRRRDEEFHDRFNEFTTSLPQASALRWIVAFAVPETVNPRARKLSADTAAKVINTAWASPIAAGFGPSDLTRDETKRGLRRFRRTGRRPIRAAEPATMLAHVEVHFDGAVAVAFTRDGAIPGEGHQPTHVPVDDIEQTGLQFLALLMALRSQLDVAGDYNARLTVYPATEIFRRPDPGTRGYYQPWDMQRIYGYRPVDGVLTGTGDDDALLTSGIELIADAVNQAGSPCSLDGDALIRQLR